MFGIISFSLHHFLSLSPFSIVFQLRTNLLFSPCTNYFIIILILCRVPPRYSSLAFPRTNDLSFYSYFSVVFLSTHLLFSPCTNDFSLFLISYFNSTGASEKYVPAISPVINQDTLGGLCPMPDVRLEGFSPHRSSDRYHSHIFFSGFLGPFLLSSTLRFYIGWNQTPLTSRCLMLVAG